MVMLLSEQNVLFLGLRITESVITNNLTELVLYYLQRSTGSGSLQSGRLPGGNETAAGQLRLEFLGRLQYSMIKGKLRNVIR